LFHIARGPASRRRLLALAAVAGLFMLLTSGLQTLPGYEYGRLALRWTGAGAQAWNEAVPYSVHQHYSFTPASLLGMVLPGRFQHMNPFIGVTALSLALLALALGWKDHPPVRFFGLIALLGLLFSMGGENLFHGLLYSVVPLFDKARAPARALVIFNLGVAPLIAFGLDALRDQPLSLWLRRMTWCLAALALGIFAVSGGLSIAGRLSLETPVMFTGLAAALLAGLRANDDVAAFLHWQARPLRVDVSDQDIPSNFGDWHLIDTLGGYMPGVTANVFRLGAHLPRVQDLLAVNYRVARNPSRANQQLVFKGVSGVNVYRNPAALPRARVVHELVQARSYEELGRLHADESFDPRKKAAMLAPPPQLERCEGAAEPVTFLTMQPARVVLEATLGCRGMLVLADTAFPGWKAKVDGRQVALHEVSGALRGVVVEGGRHRIEMTYRPASATLGAVMTLSGLLGAWLLRRRERRFN